MMDPALVTSYYSKGKDCWQIFLCRSFLEGKRGFSTSGPLLQKYQLAKESAEILQSFSLCKRFHNQKCRILPTGKILLVKLPKMPRAH